MRTWTGKALPDMTIDELRHELHTWSEHRGLDVMHVISTSRILDRRIFDMLTGLRDGWRRNAEANTDVVRVVWEEAAEDLDEVMKTFGPPFYVDQREEPDGQ